MTPQHRRTYIAQQKLAFSHQHMLFPDTPPGTTSAKHSILAWSPCTQTGQTQTPRLNPMSSLTENPNRVSAFFRLTSRMQSHVDQLQNKNGSDPGSVESQSLLQRATTAFSRLVYTKSQKRHHSHPVIDTRQTCEFWVCQRPQNNPDLGDPNQMRNSVTTSLGNSASPSRIDTTSRS
jgi:hypothetical protein